MKRQSVLRLILSVMICQSAGLLGAAVTVPAVGTWYAGLSKPGFTPPAWVFGPVWNVLYLLMGISLFLVWEKGFRQEAARKALVWFILQILLNVIWSFLFFGLRAPLAAFVEIVILGFAVFFMIKAFMKVSPAAAFLNLPYLFWTVFAAVLNYAFWILNR